MSELKVRLTADGTQALKNLKTLSSTVEDTSKSLAQLAQNANQYEVLTKQLNAAAKGSDAYNRIEKKRAALDEDLVKIQQKYNLVLARKLNSMALSGEQTEVLTRQTKLLKAQMEKLAEVTRDNDFLNKKIELYDIYLGKLNKAKAAEEQARKEKAKEIEQAKALKELQQDILKARQQYNQVVASAKSEFEATWATAKAQQQAYTTQGQNDFLKSWETAKSQNVSYLKATALGDNYTIMAQQYSLLDAELTKILSTEGKVTERSQELAKEMNKLKASMDKASKTSLGDRMKNLVKSFVSAQVVVYALQKAVSLVTNTIKEASEAAASAEETANLFNTTFANVAATANNVASKMSSSLGMANSTIQQSLGLFGDLAMGYGESQDSALKFAEAAVQTGLDIMSFKNISGDTTEVLQTMASGLAGNFENFRKWGIIVTQAEIKTRLQQKGLDKLTGSSLQFAKVQETLAIVQEKSKNAVGDMKDTLDSTENTVRRFNEANKELLENLGQGINPVLNTLRNIWIDIATQINKAVKAEKEFAKGSYVTGVYDIKNNEEDDKAFRRAIGENAFGTYSIGPFTNILNVDNYAKTVSDAMILFDASLEETINTVKEEVNISTDNLNKVIEALLLKDNERKQWDELQKAIEKRRVSVESNASSAQSFIDNLNNITGVSIKNQEYGLPAKYTTEAFYTKQTGKNTSDRMIGNVLTESINEAIQSLSEADWTEFADVIGVALGDVTEASGLEEKLNSIYSLYEAVYNLRLENGKLTEEERAELQQIASLYAKTKKEIEDITKLEETRSKISSVAESNEALKISINEIGLSDLEKAINALQREIVQIAFSDLSTEEKATAKALYERRIELLKEEDSAKKLLEAEQKYVETLKDITDKKIDLETQIRQYGMSDREIALDEINQEWISALKDITDDKKIEEINKKFSEMINLTKKFYTLQENEKKRQAFYDANSEYRNQMIEFRQRKNPFASTYSQIKLNAADSWAEWLSNNDTSSFSDLSNKRNEYIQGFIDKSLYEQYAEMGEVLKTSLGETWQLFDAIGQLASGGGFGGLLGVLIDLTAKTEAFTKLSSLLSDHVVPVLDAMLRPLLPVIDFIGQSIAGIVEFFASILYPLISEVSQALSLVFGTVKAVINFFVDGGKWVIGQIYGFFQDMINGIIDLINNIPFVNIGHISGGAVDEWRKIDVFGNFDKTMKEVLETTQDIRDLDMKIEQNTSNKNEEALKTIEDLYSRGVLTASQRDAEVASLAGNKYDVTKLFAGGAYRSTGYQTTVSYGDMTFIINTDSMSGDDVKELAKEVIRQLDEKARPGSNTLAS